MPPKTVLTDQALSQVTPKMSPQLNVTIIGAGLAGLAAARFLRHPNHSITVLESSLGGHEVGAALSLGPTAIRLLEPTGFSRERCGALKAVASRTFGPGGKQIHNQDMQEFSVDNPADWLMFHRADLWDELLWLATGEKVGVFGEHGVVGKPAQVRFGVEVIGVNVESGDVKLASGEVVKSDLVVGAWLRVMNMPIYFMLTMIMANQEPTASDRSSVLWS